MSFYSVLNILSVIFNPAFLGNYAVTTMAVTIMFQKYRTALFWLPTALTMIIMSETGYTKFLDLIEEANASQFHTLTVKYNFQTGYVDMLDQYMKESLQTWIYDYAIQLNRLGTFLQICAVLGMSGYIVNYAPYNLWLYKRQRWDKFVRYYIVNALFTSCLGLLYMGLGLYRAYTLPEYTLFCSEILIILPLIFIVATQLSVLWIKVNRANMIDHYLSMSDESSQTSDDSFAYVGKEY